jgi:hypothetical protein
MRAAREKYLFPPKYGRRTSEVGDADASVAKTAAQLFLYVGVSAVGDCRGCFAGMDGGGLRLPAAMVVLAMLVLTVVS